MVDIVGINTTTHQANKVSDRSTIKGGAGKSKEAGASSAAGDRIEISAGAKEAQAVKRLVTAAQAQPDVRPEAVSRAKEKLSNGELDGPEVSRQTARKILGL